MACRRGSLQNPGSVNAAADDDDIVLFHCFLGASRRIYGVGVDATPTPYFSCSLCEPSRC